MSGFTPGASREVIQSPLTSASLLADQLFVVGRAFRRPSKLVNQILAGKYIDLSELLAANLVNADPEPQLLFDGRLVLTKRQRQRVKDLPSWIKAFSIYSLVLTSHFPHR